MFQYSFMHVQEILVELCWTWRICEPPLEENKEFPAASYLGLLHYFGHPCCFLFSGVLLHKYTKDLPTQQKVLKVQGDWPEIDWALYCFDSAIYCQRFLTSLHIFLPSPWWKKINPSNWQWDYSARERCHHHSTSCPLCVIWTVSNTFKGRTLLWQETSYWACPLNCTLMSNSSRQVNLGKY